MNLLLTVTAVFGAAGLFAQTALPASLSGVITDPSGASIPQALVQVRGPGGERRVRTDVAGRYSLPNLAEGKYLVRVLARGFAIAERKDFSIAGATTLEVQLTIEATAQVINVEEEANRLSTEASSNASALVLREKELATLSDDPDELSQQLQAMAGPSAGPNGGQIYVDGFTGGQMPPKSSIREIRINSNPYSPEYDRPGFGRIEILTKPGSDFLRGQVFLQFNKEALNSRSPLLAQSKRPPYQQKFFGFNLSGPVSKSKASFGLDFERRNITENAFVYATTLDDNLNPLPVNQAIVTPQVRTSFSPRLDYSINTQHTLTMRYQGTRVRADKEGVGNFGLASRAYDQQDRDDTLQATETAVLSTKVINETRAQFTRSDASMNGDNTVPALSVQGAFEGGGAQAGRSGSVSKRIEITNLTTLSAGTHIVKWGARVRQSFIDDTSVANFGGTFTFFGGTGPQLDSANSAVPGTSLELSALERYRRTLLFQRLGYAGDQIRALGGGASQFALSAGTPATSVRQSEIGLFANDDWKVRPNFTLSYGFRYEAQTNLGDLADFSPRVGFAWGVDGGGRPTKTVVRGGFGVFYDRLAESSTLQVLRYNGVTQQSFIVSNPDFYPTVPSPAALSANVQPQLLYDINTAYVAPRTYQASASLERQITRSFKLSAQYIHSRGVHLSRSVNVNAPVDGVYPYGDKQMRLDTQSTGFSRANQLVIAPNVSFKNIFLFGFYGLSYGKTDAEGTSADPNNLRAEWGPSSFADVRHRLLLGSSLPLPAKFSISPFFVASSGSPYNITTGQDANGDGFAAERPAALAGLSTSQCAGGGLIYRAGFGCFNLNPAPGTAIVRNYGRGPSNVTLNLRLARSWGFGNRGESGPDGAGPPPGMGGVRGGGPPPGGGPGGPGGGGPPPGGGPGGGPPRGMFGATTGKKYNVMLSLSAHNVLNHPNYSAPSGDLSSPYFGQSRGLAGFGPFAGNTTYNRKIDVQLRFTF